MRIRNLRTYMWPILALAAVVYLSLAAASEPAGARSAAAPAPTAAPSRVDRPIPLDPGDLPVPTP